MQDEAEASPKLDHFDSWFRLNLWQEWGKRVDWGA